MLEPLSPKGLQGDQEETSWDWRKEMRKDHLSRDSDGARGGTPLSPWDPKAPCSAFLSPGYGLPSVMVEIAAAPTQHFLALGGMVIDT